MKTVLTAVMKSYAFPKQHHFLLAGTASSGVNLTACVWMPAGSVMMRTTVMTAVVKAVKPQHHGLCPQPPLQPRLVVQRVSCSARRLGSVYPATGAVTECQTARTGAMKWAAQWMTPARAIPAAMDVWKRPGSRKAISAPVQTEWHSHQATVTSVSDNRTKNRNKAEKSPRGSKRVNDDFSCRVVTYGKLEVTESDLLCYKSLMFSFEFVYEFAETCYF